MRSASPVSTLYGASMNTDRVFLSLISTEGSNALKGRVWPVMSEEVDTDEEG